MFKLRTHQVLYFFINRSCLLEAMNYTPCFNFPKGLWRGPFFLHSYGKAEAKATFSCLILITKCMDAWVHTHREGFKKKIGCKAPFKFLWKIVSIRYASSGTLLCCPPTSLSYCSSWIQNNMSYLIHLVLFTHIKAICCPTLWKAECSYYGFS